MNLIPASNEPFTLAKLRRMISDRDMKALNSWIVDGWDVNSGYWLFCDTERMYRLVAPVHLMVPAGWQDGLTRLLKAGANADQVSTTRKVYRYYNSLSAITLADRTPLISATESGNLPMVETLLEYGATCNIQEDTTGNTPLRLALIRGHIKMAKLLIRSGADVAATGKQLNTTHNSGRAFFVPQSLLTLAIRQFNNTILPLSKSDLNGERPAVERDAWLEVVSLLVDGGAPVNTAGYGMECSPLVESVESSDTRVMLLLINKGGAQVNGKTHVELNASPLVDSALSLACFMDNYAALQILINNGADISQVPECLFQYMLKNKYYQSAKLLMLAGYQMTTECRSYLGELTSVHMQMSDNALPAFPGDLQVEPSMVRYSPPGHLSQMCDFTRQPKPLIWNCRHVLRTRCNLYQPKLVQRVGLPRKISEYLLCYHD